MKKLSFLRITNPLQCLFRKNSAETFETCIESENSRNRDPINHTNTSSRRALFMTIFTCAAVLFPGTAVIPAEAQYTGWLEASITPTPTLSPEPTETPVSEEYYMPKIFVPTNTPEPMDAVQIIPNQEDKEICEIMPIPECDHENLPINHSDTTATFAKVHLELQNAPSFTGTYGLIYQNTCADSKCHLIDLISSKPAIDMALFYDTSTGSTGINAKNTQSKLESIALNSSSGQDVKTYLLNTSVDLFNEKDNAEITAKVFDVTQTGSEAAINVFGDASVKVIPDGEANAKKIEANAVELTANGGTVRMNVGAVKTDVSYADVIAAEGVKITAKNNTEGRFTSGRQWYYHVNKWEQKGDESLVVDPDNLDVSNELTFTVKSKVIENTDSYNITRIKSGYTYGKKTYDIYFLENESTGEKLYAAQNTMTGSDNNYYEAMLKTGTYKQCEPAYPGDITVSAAGNAINAYGAQLITKSGDNTIHFETTNGGGISVTANGSDGTAYGLYTDSAGGTINALIEGSITESGITGADLGDTAGIAMDGTGGQVNIQVGVKPTEPPVGTKEVKVSGSRIGIYNKSGSGQEKKVVIFGTVTGNTVPILTDSSVDSSFTLAVWSIDLKDGHAAFTKENGTLAADKEFEKNIRYILLTDPSAANTVTIESAGTDEARSIKENKNIGTISGYCKSDFYGGYGINLRDEKADFYIQNLKENTETYTWANAGDTVTVKSKEEGYYITEAYWSNGTGEEAKMDCSDGICTFTVPMGGGVWIHGIELKPLISQDVTFKVANGEWNDGGNSDITVTVSGPEGETLTLAGVTIPQAGKNPAAIYKPGKWDTEPTETTIVDADHHTFTYTYIPKEAIIRTVTFIVISGAWNDGTTDRKTVPLTGYEGDTLKLLPTDIPAVGKHPDAGYTSGTWNVIPNTETAIKADTVYTYTYEKLTSDKYKTVRGENQDYKIGSGQDAVFEIIRIEDDRLTYQKFIHKIELKSSKSDYRLVNPQNYDYEEGSLIIKLHADYLNTFQPDHYTLKVYFEDGIDEIPFTISKEDNIQPYHWLPCYDCILPGTGFRAAYTTDMPKQLKELNITPLHMRLQIPTLNKEIEIVKIPRSGNSWDVQSLDDRAGLMEGFSMPGEGYSMIAAHNTLRETEYGPFALLSTLEVNDMITVNTEDGSMNFFRVYANELFEPDDMLKLAEIAEQETDSLILITCENESMYGGYLNRRVVFAKPILRD